MVSSRQRAAILLMSLPAEDAADLIGNLPPGQAEAVTVEIAKLARCTLDQQIATIVAFAAANLQNVGGRSSRLEVAKSLLENALGTLAATGTGSTQPTRDAFRFGFLKDVAPQRLQAFLQDERPQTIALVLSYLPPAFAAQVLAGLTIDRQTALIARIANMGDGCRDSIALVAAYLQRHLANQEMPTTGSIEGLASAAEILSVSGEATEGAILEALAADSPDLVDAIRQRMAVA